MSEKLKQIDELRKRASVSYSDAKEALEECNGDMLDALVYLEKNNKGQYAKTANQKSGFLDKLNELFRKGSNTRFIMHKQEKIILNISINIAVLITLITLPFIQITALGLLIALFTGHRFKVQGCSNDTDNINHALERVSNAADEIKERFASGKPENTDGLNK
ncbi:MAG: ubiquitin-associated- protein [Clostridia bacterium]|nr:ubiquitin-associated- protein [Clostridia bacterium]